MSGSVMNIHQYVNPDFDKYHNFLSQHCKQVNGGRPSLGSSQTQQVLSSSSNQLTDRKVTKPDSYKTVMCQAWLESTACPFAENCRFAHGEEELRPIKIAPRQNSKYKTKLCDKYTTIGICPYGSRCLFIHPDPHKRASSFPRSEQNVNPFAPQNGNIHSGFGAIGSRPHPSWPLESPAFYRRTSTGSVSPFSSNSSSVCWTGGSSGEVTPDRDSLSDAALSIGSSISAMSDTPRISRMDHYRREERVEYSDGRAYDPFMMASGADSLARRLADVMDIWK
uniref:C3H1-type domain-containing protein n=1 Tax=Steinernema glaseri TaxID=37863 RepID=A0A1I7XYP7_9BILA